jgi:hypothetical protein
LPGKNARNIQAGSDEQSSDEEESDNHYINTFKSTGIGSLSQKSSPRNSVSSEETDSYDGYVHGEDESGGYVGDELNELARVVQHKQDKPNSNKQADTQRDEEDLEVLNSITALEEIINSEGNTHRMSEVNSANICFGSEKRE